MERDRDKEREREREEREREEREREREREYAEPMTMRSVIAALGRFLEIQIALGHRCSESILRNSKKHAELRF